MPKKKYQKQQPIDTSSIDQFEIDATDSNFNLFFDNKKIKEKTRIQISILKDFFESYKSSSGYERKDAIDIVAFGDKLSAKYVKKLFELSCQYDPEVQDLIKIDQQDLMPVVLLSKLQSLISNLDDKKNYDLTSKKIFAIMNRLLPYYPVNIREYFDLEGLFYSLGKMRIIFFKNLNGILSKKPKSNLFQQIQISCLCSMLLWVSNSKSKNFYLFLDALLVLSNSDLKSFMFNAYSVTDDEIISILPSPLRMADILSNYYPDKVLYEIKTNFLEFQKQNSLQMSLRREFIVFIDSALDFALTTNTKNRTFILQHYDNFRPLIKKIFLSYDSPSMSSQALAISNTILEMMDKWQACIQANRQAFEKSEQTGLELSGQEDLEIKTHNQALLALALQAQPSKQTIQAAQQFAARKLKNAEEEALAIKKNEAEKLAQPSLIDQYQNDLTEKFSIISNTKYPEKEQLFNSKERIIIQEIVKFMRLTPIDKLLDKGLLEKLEYGLFSLNEIPAYELHILLLDYINLLDIFLSRISYKMQIYKEQYVPLIQKMFDRHGQKDFSRADHVLNRQIKRASTLILDNLTVTNDYCECILIIFNIINLLKLQIKDNEFYKIWNLPINFRKGEYKDNYFNADANLTQFRSYLENKSQACKKLGIRINKNKINGCEISENEISQELEKLMNAIYKIDNRINKNDFLTHQFPKVFLTKQSQARQQEIQNTVIESNRVRVPIDYNPSDVLRKSQSFTNLYTKPSFFTLILESNINTEEENISLLTKNHNRKMSI
ncbi:MAG: hypothetical protein RJA25_395 [Bacteroidota bacterium]|jgi:hypothetical protein